MRISDWSSDVCSSDLQQALLGVGVRQLPSGPATGRATYVQGVSLDRLLIDGKGRTPSGCPANPSLPDQSVKFGLRTRGRVIPFSALPEGVPQSREKNRPRGQQLRSEEHTSELQSLMRISYAVFCLKKKTKTNHRCTTHKTTHND